MQARIHTLSTLLSLLLALATFALAIDSFRIPTYLRWHNSQWSSGRWDDLNIFVGFSHGLFRIKYSRISWPEETPGTPEWSALHPEPGAATSPLHCK